MRSTFENWRGSWLADVGHSKAVVRVKKQAEKVEQVFGGISYSELVKQNGRIG